MELRELMKVVTEEGLLGDVFEINGFEHIEDVVLLNKLIRKSTLFNQDLQERKKEYESKPEFLYKRAYGFSLDDFKLLSHEIALQVKNVASILDIKLPDTASVLNDQVVHQTPSSYS